MDPNVCYKRFVDAENEYVLSGLDKEKAERYYQEMKDAHNDLVEWLNKGGFEPNWGRYGYTRESFVNFFNENNGNYVIL